MTDKLFPTGRSCMHLSLPAHWYPLKQNFFNFQLPTHWTYSTGRQNNHSVHSCSCSQWYPGSIHVAFISTHAGWRPPHASCGESFQGVLLFLPSLNLQIHWTTESFWPSATPLPWIFHGALPGISLPEISTTAVRTILQPVVKVPNKPSTPFRILTWMLFQIFQTGQNKHRNKLLPVSTAQTGTILSLPFLFLAVFISAHASCSYYYSTYYLSPAFWTNRWEFCRDVGRTGTASHSYSPTRRKKASPRPSHLVLSGIRFLGLPALPPLCLSVVYTVCCRLVL